MTPEEIKAELILNGKTQSAIAESIKFSRAYINHVISGRFTNREIRKAIAKAIGKPLLEVFPDEKFRRPSGRIVRRAGFRA